jgi:hypothetical protein
MMDKKPKHEKGNRREFETKESSDDERKLKSDDGLS